MGAIYQRSVTWKVEIVVHMKRLLQQARGRKEKKTERIGKGEEMKIFKSLLMLSGNDRKLSAAI